MERKKISNWLTTAALLPLLAAGLTTGCDDDENSPTVDAGTGGTGGTAGTGRRYRRHRLAPAAPAAPLAWTRHPKPPRRSWRLRRADHGHGGRDRRHHLELPGVRPHQEDLRHRQRQADHPRWHPDPGRRSRRRQAGTGHYPRGAADRQGTKAQPIIFSSERRRRHRARAATGPAWCCWAARRSTSPAGKPASRASPPASRRPSTAGWTTRAAAATHRVCPHRVRGRRDRAEQRAQRADRGRLRVGHQAELHPDPPRHGRRHRVLRRHGRDGSRRAVGQRGRQPGLGLRLERQGPVHGRPQRAGFGDYGIEAAGSPTSETAVPRSEPVLYNLTMIGSNSSTAALNFKQGTRGKIYNSIIQGWKNVVGLPGGDRRLHHRMADVPHRREQPVLG